MDKILVMSLGGGTLPAPGPDKVLGGHVARFYDQDTSLAGDMGEYLAGALAQSAGVVMVARPTHLDALATRLEEQGFDLAALRAEGRYLERDAARTLEVVLRGGEPAADVFSSSVGDVVRRAAGSAPEVAVFGEIVDVLWGMGQVAAALKLERLWNELAQEVTFSLFCAYSDRSAAGAHLAELEQVAHLHSALLGPSPGAMRAGALGGVSRDFPLTADAPRWARHFVAATLEEWGATRLREDAALIVTELATNAVVHAGSAFRVVVSAQDGSVRIAVADNSFGLPREGAFSEASGSGRGLGIVSGLSAKWGTDPLDRGKAVWAELHR